MKIRLLVKYIAILLFIFTSVFIFSENNKKGFCQNLYKESKVPIIIIDPETSLIFDSNEAAQNFYGYSEQELTGMSINSINTLSDFEIKEEMKHAVLEKRNYFIFKHKLASGMIKDVEVYSSTIFVGDKKYLASIVHDITEEIEVLELLRLRTAIFISSLLVILIIQFVIIVFYIRANILKKAAQASLIEKSGEFDRFFSLKTDILCVFNKNLEFIKVNEACENIFGKTRCDVIGTKLLEFIADDDEYEFLKTVKEINTDDHSETIEVKLKTNDDTVRYSEWNISRYGENYYGIVRDNTDKHLRAEKKIKMEKQILQTQKLESLGVLAGGIAHDFNNILMAVLGHTELARMEITSNSPAYGNLKEIENASKKASKLCSQMLAYTGRASYALEKVNINKLITEMLHLVKTLVSKKAVLNLSITDNIPYINADPSQISQVIMNLIINSSDAIGDKNGIISISTGSAEFDSEYLSKTDLNEDLEPGNYVYFEISDTGCGISSDNIDRIFEPFYTTKFTGRGLGLAAVQGIIRSHKGSIKVYSEEGKGTNIKVMFPSVTKNLYESNNTTEESQKNWKGSGTVLFVDDEDTLRFLGSDMLTKLGYDVITASDGVEALDIYKKRKDDIDLIVLDLTMPNMDGSQAFSEIRNINEDIKVIIASGYSYNDITVRFSGKNLAGIIEKPYSMKKMRQILKNI